MSNQPLFLQRQLDERELASRKESRRREFHNSVAYHKVGTNDKEVLARFKAIRDATTEFGDIIIDNTDVSREQSLALTHAEDASMWAVKQVAVHNLPIAE